MKFMVILILTLLAGIPSCALAQDMTRQYGATVKVKVDTRGQVAYVGTPDRLPKILVPFVRHAIASWRFKPLNVNGHAASATTWVRVTVKLMKQPDNHYGVKVVYDGNGPKWQENIWPDHMPEIPPRALRMGVSAVVMVGATVEPDGTIDDVHLLKKKGHLIPLFMRSIRKAMSQLHAMPMLVNGKPIASHVTETFGFHANVGGSSAPPHSAFPFGKKSSAPAWARRPSGQLVATDSPLQRLDTTSYPGESAGSG
ncbi:MAG TPA: energy transducer TonB [Oleiagrimonas sp.]|nr:energy transducer TonB [Oleiagrimonas sp.]